MNTEDDTEDSLDVMKHSPMATIEEEAPVETAPTPKPMETSEYLEDLGDLDLPDFESSSFAANPKKRPQGVVPWNPKSKPSAPAEPAAERPEPEAPKLKLGVKAATPQSELSLDSTPRGRFEGENPNVVDGEDLDLPPFLRKKK